MDRAEFIEALHLIEKEKGIDKEIIFEAIEASLVSACKKNFGSNQNIKVVIDRETGNVVCYAQREVVEEVMDEQNEIDLMAARILNPSYQIGDTVDLEVTPRDFGRVAAQTAKQVVVQNCTAEDAGAHKTPKLTVSNSCEIKCVALVRMIYRDMRWNRNNTYRLEGKSVPRQQLVSFDLDIPFLVENGKALDENPSPTKPLCGEELSAAESSSASPIKRDSGAL